jgi:hypothetical protein
VKTPLHEPRQLRLGLGVLAEAPEGVAVPEAYVTLELSGRAGRQRFPGLPRLHPAPESVVGQTEAVASPARDRYRHGPAQDLGEGITGSCGIAKAQGSPAARVETPYSQLAAGPFLSDLAEELVRGFYATDPVVALAEPVPGFLDDLAVRGPRGRLERLGGVVILPLLKP